MVDESVDGKSPKGPQPDRLKIDLPFENAVRKALKKDRPNDGWPEKEPNKDG